MAWIYLQITTELPDSTFSVESEVSPSLCATTCEQSPTAKSSDTVRQFFCQECLQGTCAEHPSGMTLCHLMETNSMDTLISYLVASHAKTSALQALEKAWQESEADYFSRSLGCVARLSPDLSFWRMYQPLLLEGDQKWSGKLPRWGMIVGGVLYQLRALERYTSARDGSCWPTPNARDWKDTASQGNRKSPNLGAKVLSMMATPTASQANKPIRAPSPSRAKGEHGEDLQDSIGRLNPESIGKKLCPQWVSVLMGYPITWTDCEPWAIRSCPSKSKKRFKS